MPFEGSAQTCLEGFVGAALLDMGSNGLADSLGNRNPVSLSQRLKLRGLVGRQS